MALDATRAQSDSSTPFLINLLIHRLIDSVFLDTMHQQGVIFFSEEIKYTERQPGVRNYQWLIPPQSQNRHRRPETSLTIRQRR